MTSTVVDSYQLWCLSRLVRNKLVHVLNGNRASVTMHETVSPAYAHFVQLDPEEGPADEEEERRAQQMIRWLLTGEGTNPFADEAEDVPTGGPGAQGAPVAPPVPRPVDEAEINAAIEAEERMQQDLQQRMERVAQRQAEWEAQQRFAAMAAAEERRAREEWYANWRADAVTQARQMGELTYSADAIALTLFFAHWGCWTVADNVERVISEAEGLHVYFGMPEAPDFVAAKVAIRNSIARNDWLQQAYYSEYGLDPCPRRQHGRCLGPC